jgi:integrase
MKPRRVQDVTATELARLLRDLRDTYSPWTCVAVYRLLAGTFALAVRRGIVTRSPVEGLAPSERPKQRNAKRVRVLEPATIDALVRAGKTKRWQTAIGLAGYAGLRLGELRGLRWQDVDLSANLLHVERSLLPDGTAKPPKTEAGKRDVPLLPALRRLLVEWKLEAPHSKGRDLIVGTADGCLSLSGTSAARSTTRRRGRSSPAATRSGSPGTRSGTHSRQCSRPTSSYLRRRSLV